MTNIHTPTHTYTRHTLEDECIRFKNENKSENERRASMDARLMLVLCNSITQTAVFRFSKEPFLKHLPREMAMWTHPAVGPQSRF
jgi:hypothetical protein